MKLSAQIVSLALTMSAVVTIGSVVFSGCYYQTCDCPEIGTCDDDGGVRDADEDSSTPTD